MVRMTQSFEHWLFEFHKDIFTMVILGHLELLTDEMRKEYFEWCETDEGKQYLKGGSKYDAEHEGNKACEDFCNRGMEGDADVQ